MSFCSFEVHRVARSSTNEVNLKTISISSLLVLATETIQGKSTRKLHMSLVDPVTLRGSTQRFVLVHLRVRKARSSSYFRPRREIDHVDLISDRSPCDHISKITVPRDHATKIAVAAEKPRLELDRQTVLKTLKRTPSSSWQHAFVRSHSLHELFYELYFLLAKKLTEAADALYGTLSHMLVFSQ